MEDEREPLAKKWAELLSEFQSSQSQLHQYASFDLPQPKVVPIYDAASSATLHWHQRNNKNA